MIKVIIVLIIIIEIISRYFDLHDLILTATLLQ